MAVEFGRRKKKKAISCPARILQDGRAKKKKKKKRKILWKQRILGDRITIKCYECSGSTANADTATWNLERLINLVEIGKSFQAWSLLDMIGQKAQAG